MGRRLLHALAQKLELELEQELAQGQGEGQREGPTMSSSERGLFPDGSIMPEFMPWQPDLGASASARASASAGASASASASASANDGGMGKLKLVLRGTIDVTSSTTSTTANTVWLRGTWALDRAGLHSNGGSECASFKIKLPSGFGTAVNVYMGQTCKSSSSHNSSKIRLCGAHPKLEELVMVTHNERGVLQVSPERADCMPGQLWVLGIGITSVARVRCKLLCDMGRKTFVGYKEYTAQTEGQLKELMRQLKATMAEQNMRQEAWRSRKQQKQLQHMEQRWKQLQRQKQLLRLQQTRKRARLAPGPASPRTLHVLQQLRHRMQLSTVRMGTECASSSGSIRNLGCEQRGDKEDPVDLS